MSQLMLINPRKRRAPRKSTSRRRGASAARMAAIRPRRAVRTLARNPIARRHTRHLARRRIRRNPMSGGTGVGAQLMQGLVGGAGAVVVDVIQGYVPLPASLATGYGPYVVKGALGLLLGTLGRKMFGQTAVKMGAGAITVAAYGALKTATAGMLPGATPAAVAGMGQFITGPGSRLGYMNPVPNAGMGEYMPDSGQYYAGGGFGNY